MDNKKQEVIDHLNTILPYYTISRCKYYYEGSCTYNVNDDKCMLVSPNDDNCEIFDAGVSELYGEEF